MPILIKDFIHALFNVGVPPRRKTDTFSIENDLKKGIFYNLRLLWRIITINSLLLGIGLIFFIPYSIYPTLLLLVPFITISFELGSAPPKVKKQLSGFMKGLSFLLAIAVVIAILFNILSLNTDSYNAQDLLDKWDSEETSLLLIIMILALVVIDRPRKSPFHPDYILGKRYSIIVLIKAIFLSLLVPIFLIFFLLNPDILESVKIFIEGIFSSIGELLSP